jgi:DNA repair protein RadC
MVSKFKPAHYSTYQLRQLVWRFKDVEEVPEGFKRTIVRSPEDIYRSLRFMFAGLTVEQFVVVCLNSQNGLSAVDVVTSGTLNTSLVHPREVFRTAIVTAAASIIVIHNHPSGNPEPSREDAEVTRQLVESGRILGIPVHDHVIFTEEGYTSLAERGLL